MSTMLDGDLLTVAEAAALLKVHASTIRRWIAQGDLPAYRVGQRRVALRRDDLVNLISPARLGTENASAAADLRRQLPPMTPERRRQGLEAVERARKRLAELLAERGGRPYESSWELLNEWRDERTRQLEEALSTQSPDFVPPRLTLEEQRRGLEAFARLQRLGEEILARRGAVPFPDSWEVINEQRDQRSRELG